MMYNKISLIKILYTKLCSKSCWSVNSFNFRGKNAWALQRECSFSSFSSENSNELTDQQDMFRFTHASAFYTSNNIVKNVD